jgi:hypothetical protein
MTGEKPVFLEIGELLEGKTERSKEWLKGAEDQSKKTMQVEKIKRLPNGTIILRGVKEK